MKRKAANKIIRLLQAGFVAMMLLNPAVGAEVESNDFISDEPLPLEQLRLFAEVYNRIKSNYVEDVDDQVLINGAIAGMLDSLDPHSSFLDKDAFDNLQKSSTGQYGGLGIEVVPEDNAIRIITPIDDSPAKRAGILPGDQILKINRTHMQNITAEDAMELMRGEVGENVHLTIRREGERELLEFDLVREIIQLSSVYIRWLGDGMVSLRITSFQTRTGYDLIDAIENIREQHEGKIEGMVLDIRNNPGGMLAAANAVSDAFLHQGTIVSTRGRNALVNAEYSASKGDVLYGAPIVVLINGGSASAAEIVAGALQDHNRAIIMGTHSFGKGSVQNVIPTGTGTALKLTTARYYTPSGRSIQGKGIVPDVLVEQLEMVKSEKNDNQIYESDLKGALMNEEGQQAQDEVEKKEIEALLAIDFQLSEALNLLRGIRVLSSKATKKWQQPK
ncbi:MAG: S41 family peptidase [Gammaproteobacteria bacterium]|nr:S41 family peptidase [Gammaproteobacteria bacterium]